MGELGHHKMSTRSAVLLFLVTLAVCAARAPKSPALAGQPVILSVSNLHDGDLHVYWEGSYDAHHNFEKLVATVSPGQREHQNTMTGHAFTLRSSDGKFRMLIKVYENIEEDSREFRIDFLNLNHDGPGISAIELQHGPTSKPEYVWIDSGSRITHSTDPHHIFRIRDSNKVRIVDLMLLP